MQSVFEFVNDSLRPHVKAVYLSLEHKSTLGSLKDDLTKSNDNLEKDITIWCRGICFYLFNAVRMESWV